MRSRSTTLSDKSDDSLRDDYPSPQTPPDAGGDFVHSPAAIMNQPLLQSFPLGQSYSLPSEQDCIDHLGTNAAHHTPYTNGGVPEHLRRDSELGVGQTNLLPLNSSIRPLAYRPAAHDPPFHTHSNISDSGSGSISTSPSSNASSLAYSNPFPGTLYTPGHSSVSLANPYPTASQVYSNNIQFPPQYNSSMFDARHKLSSITDPSPGLLPPARPSFGLGNTVSPHSSVTIRGNYTTSTPGLSKHMISPRSQLESLSRSYNPITDTPRSMTSGASMSLSPAGTYSTGAGLNYQNQQDPRQVETPPFSDQEDFHEVHCDGHVVKPNIDAKIEKGFFYSSDHCWTCYRRNYFSVQCSYTLSPHCSNRTMYLSRTGGKGQEQIQAMAICLSAAVDGSAGKNIELVQHTPKRDKGPQTAIQITKLAPTPPGGKLPQLHADSQGYTHSLPPFGQASSASAFASPYLPLQTVPEPTAVQHQDQQPTSPSAHQHTFERIQFKSATANNGKRRAQQQYYHLIIELYCDVRHPNDRSPTWVKVAQRASSQVVVRGRSPSHYSNEGPHSSGPRGAGGASGGSGIGPLTGTHGSGFTTTGYGRPLGSGFTYGGYRGGSQYSHDPSPIGSNSDSSSSSLSGGPVDAFPDQGRPSILSSNAEDEDGMPIETFDGYQYYPSPLYEAGLPPSVKSEGQGHEIGRVKEQANGLFGPGSLFTGGLGRLQGVESSRGFFTADTVY